MKKLTNNLEDYEAQLELNTHWKVMSFHGD